MIDNRKKKKKELGGYKFKYPEVDVSKISKEVYNDVSERNKRSQQMKSETKFKKLPEEVLYEINDFEIFTESLSSKKQSHFFSSPERYIHIEKLNSQEKLKYYIQGVITGPDTSKYHNQIICAEISEYSLQYGEREEWSTWIQLVDSTWLKLNAPYKSYSKFFSPMYYRFKVVMITTDFFENKGNQKRLNNLEKLEEYLKKNFSEYQEGDITYFKDEVFKHVIQFLNVPLSNEKIQFVNKEIEKVIQKRNNKPLITPIDVSKFPPPQPYANVFIDRTQTEIAKELKKLKAEMNESYLRRENERENDIDDDNNNIGDDQNDEDDEENEYYSDYINGGSNNGTNEMDTSSDSKAQNYPYSYDFDYNYDDDTYGQDMNINERRDRDATNNKNNTANNADLPLAKYLHKDDKLYFDKLPLETITYKTFNSLLTLPNQVVDIEGVDFQFNTEQDITDDCLPFLICRLCGQGKHILGASCHSGQDIDREMADSIQDYIIHLEKHRTELLRSLSKKSRERLGKSLAFNNILTRAKVEKLENNCLNKHLKKKKSILNLKSSFKNLKNSNSNSNSNNNPINKTTTTTSQTFNAWP